MLATINGKPLITAPKFEKEFNNFIEKHPLGSVLKQMDGIQKQFFNGLLSQELLDFWVKDNKIDQTSEYKEQLDQLKVMLNAKHFEMKHQPKEVSDEEAKAYYEKNKDSIPEAIMSRGGVNAVGVEFDKDADAKAFLDKVKGKGGEFTKIAKEAKVDSKLRDFKLVNAQSIGMDGILRDKIVALNKFPAYSVIPAGGKFWVVYASAKEEAKLRPFDQVKANIKERLTMEAGRKAFETGIDDLKKSMHVEDRFDQWYATHKPIKESGSEEPKMHEVMPEEQTAKTMQKQAPSGKVA